MSRFSSSSSKSDSKSISNSISKSSEDSSYTVCGNFNSSSSSSKDEKCKIILFKFPDTNEEEEVAVSRDKAKRSVHNLVGGFMNCTVDGDSRIKEVSVYETPLKNFLGFTSAGVHSYVLFVVDDYYVTFEKHEEGLTIQISKDLELVKDIHMDTKREEPAFTVSDDGDKTIQQLMNFVVEENLAFEEYNAEGGIHCKKFAGDIFGYIAKKKTYNWKSKETLTRGAATTTVATAAAAASGIILGPVPALATAVGGAVATGVSAVAAYAGSKKKNN